MVTATPEQDYWLHKRLDEHRKRYGGSSYVLSDDVKLTARAEQHFYQVFDDHNMPRRLLLTEQVIAETVEMHPPWSATPFHVFESDEIIYPHQLLAAGVLYVIGKP